MTIKNHPDIASLMSCAAGSQPEALAAVVASHLSVCPECTRRVASLERIGEALFDHIEPVALKSSVPAAIARSMEAENPIESPRALDNLGLGKGEVPAPLRALIGPDLDALPWKRIGPGVWCHTLKLSKQARGNLHLIKVAPGTKLPDHGHGGEEMTLVLRGSYKDTTGHYGVGDVADLDGEIEHAPTTDAQEGCICLIASEKAARFKGVLARLMQPFLGI